MSLFIELTGLLIGLAGLILAYLAWRDSRNNQKIGQKYERITHK